MKKSVTCLVALAALLAGMLLAQEHDITGTWQGTHTWPNHLSGRPTGIQIGASLPTPLAPDINRYRARIWPCPLCRLWRTQPVSVTPNVLRGALCLHGTEREAGPPGSESKNKEG